MIDLTQFWIDTRDKYQGCYKEYGTYAFTWQPLAASAVQQGADINIGTDADFVVTNAFGSQTTSVTNAAYITTPLILGLIYSGRGNRTVTNVKTEWTTITGTAANPRIYWPYPIVIPMATQFSAQLDNPLAVAANVWLTFGGIKIFPR